MSKRRTTNLKLPDVEINTLPNKTLPFNGKHVTEKSFSFSFACFDRSHKLFNLGDDTQSDNVVSGSWFISLMDCLKDVSNHDICELKTSIHDLHRIDWDRTNVNPPSYAGNNEDLEYWQFRLDKSHGRVIGIKIDSLFYIVWLDPHHNLTDSPHYAKAKVHRAGMSMYEKQELEIQRLKAENDEYRKLFNED